MPKAPCRKTDHTACNANTQFPLDASLVVGCLLPQTDILTDACPCHPSRTEACCRVGSKRPCKRQDIMAWQQGLVAIDKLTDTSDMPPTGVERLLVRWPAKGHAHADSQAPPDDVSSGRIHLLPAVTPLQQSLGPAHDQQLLLHCCTPAHRIFQQPAGPRKHVEQLSPSSSS